MAAGVAERAFPAAVAAAEAAAAACAFPEAHEHFEAALALLDELPDGPGDARTSSARCSRRAPTRRRPRACSSRPRAGSGDAVAHAGGLTPGGGRSSTSGSRSPCSGSAT